MFWFLFVTAFTVSIDALFCGFSFTVKGKEKFLSIGIITLLVFVMCLTANYGSLLIKNVLNEYVIVLGGVLLIFIGIFNLIKKEQVKKRKNIIVFSIVTGFAVGLDGAIGNLSLALMGYNYFYVPVLIALLHGITIYIGCTVSSKIIPENTKIFSLLPPLVLILLGIYKTVGVFI